MCLAVCATREARSPERSDIVVFRHPTDIDTLYIRDVIGKAGDRIEVKGGEIWINEQKADLQISKSAKLQQAAFVVLPGHFVVSDLGDGLQYWSMVPEKNLEGRAQFILFSLRWPTGDGFPRPRIRRFFQSF